ncbi:MAG: DNA alkylation repair protein, partial [Synergistaceae bacterium]|nr:DNA alkylation repair protein [Synergistaceae bacterium]
TRKGYWRISGSWILSTTLTNEYLANLGFENFSKTNPEWVRAFIGEFRGRLAPLSIREGSKYI